MPHAVPVEDEEVNAFERLSLRAEVIRVDDVLSDPEKFRGENIIIFRLSARAMAAARKYAKYQGAKLRSQRLTMVPESDEWTERAKNFMFEVRDRIAAAMEDSTKQHKEHLYDSAKRDCGFVWPDGKTKSLYDLTRLQVWELTRYLKDMAYEAGAFMGDLEDDYLDIGEGAEK